MKYLIPLFLILLTGCSDSPTRRLVAVINVQNLKDILSKCDTINPTQKILVYTNSVTYDNGRGSECSVTVNCTSTDAYGESVYHINGQVYNNIDSNVGVFGKDGLCVSEYANWDSK